MTSNEKQIKEVLKNDLQPLLIGVRNEIKDLSLALGKVRGVSLKTLLWKKEKLNNS